MGGVADDHHVVGVPAWCAGMVEDVVGRDVELAGGDERRCGTVIVGEEFVELLALQLA